MKDNKKRQLIIITNANTMAQYCIMHHKITHHDFNVHVTPWDYVSALIELFILLNPKHI